MKTYRQYCPIARASEILAERWTPIVIRNILNGCRSYTEIASAAPGIPRSLLTKRLRQLEAAGLIDRSQRQGGRGSVYEPTAAGTALRDVIGAMGEWAERHLELQPEHCDPGFVLYTWCRSYLALDALPDKRVTVRFDFPDQPKKSQRLWFVFDGEDSEVCATYPGYDEDLVVTARSTALAEWHLGRAEWLDVVADGRIDVVGPAALRKALPSWSQRSGWARMKLSS